MAIRKEILRRRGWIASARVRPPAAALDPATLDELAELLAAVASSLKRLDDLRRKASGATRLVEALTAAGVRHLFTLSGNQILSIFDATIGRGIDLVHTRTRAAAVHIADAWGRLTEQPGVALVTAGPGHLNALSALYGARMAGVRRWCCSPAPVRGRSAGAAPSRKSIRWPPPDP